MCKVNSCTRTSHSDCNFIEVGGNGLTHCPHSRRREACCKAGRPAPKHPHYSSSVLSHHGHQLTTQFVFPLAERFDPKVIDSFRPSVTAKASEQPAAMVEPIFDYQFRLILIGDSTVGKSSLLKYFTDGKFAEVSRNAQDWFFEGSY